jgi:hypothetical protein
MVYVTDWRWRTLVPIADRVRRGADKSLPFPISYFPICSTTEGFLWIFVTRLFFYGEELLVPRPTPKLEDIGGKARRKETTRKTKT